MNRQKHAELPSTLEALLPLLFLRETDMLFAAVLIPVVCGATLLVFESLRSLTRPALFAIYLVWLSMCIALGWYLFELPPYWIWPIHFCLPQTVWAPSDAQRAKPFLFGLKKYAKRRIAGLLKLLVAALVFSCGGLFIQSQIQGATIWIFGIFTVIVFEVFRCGFLRTKK